MELSTRVCRPGIMLDAGRRYDTVSSVVLTSNPGVVAVPARLVLCLVIILSSVFWFRPGSAEKLVDPNSVAPEFRAAAEKRRAEQIMIAECSKKADQAKVLRRDRAAFVGECLDKARPD
jgi:hypothetical protein